MKITGCLIWYDESPSWLATAAAGMARVCDHIVAVDGAYSLYPGARPRSHPDQTEAIVNACEAMSVGVTVHRPDTVYWGNEVEKRQLAVRLAGAVSTPGEDWLLVFDADYQVMLLEDPALVRSILANTEHHVATYTILDNIDLQADEGMAAYARERDVDTDWTIRDRAIFRYTDDLTYGPAHYCVRGTYDGTSQWLRGPDLWPGQQWRAADCEHLGRNLVVVHRKQARAKIRAQMADGYYRMRDEHGIETVNQDTVYASEPEPVA